MEINITKFWKEEEPMDFSASVAEIGENAGVHTWNASKGIAPLYQFITDENRKEFDDYIKEFGAWEDTEITGWDLIECNALLIQMISGDMREFGYDAECWDWHEYTEESAAGQVSGRLGLGDDGQVYYYISN